MSDSVQDVVSRWKKGMTGSVAKIKERINGLTTNPMLAAAAQKDKYVTGVMEAAESGRWEDGLRSVDFNSWKQKTAEVGTQRIAAGVEAATSKMTNFLTQLLPYTDQVSKSVQAMPSGNLEDNIQRAVAAMRMMANFKYRKAR